MDPLVCIALNYADCSLVPLVITLPYKQSRKQEGICAECGECSAVRWLHICCWICSLASHQSQLHTRNAPYNCEC